MIERYGNTIDPEHRLRHRAELLVLWAALAGGPVAWLVFLQVDYALVHWACRTGARAVLRIVPMIAAVAAAGAAVMGRRIASGRLAATAGDSGTTRERTHFLGVLAMMLGAFFALVILASAVPTFVLSPCE